MRQCRVIALLVPGVAAILCAVSSIAVPLGCNYKHVPRDPELPLAGGSSAKDCKGCHSAIYAEWADSAHAEAYTRGEYRLATRDYREKDCLRCHVPASQEGLAKDPVRTARLSEGINCESCHLVGQAYAAPKFYGSYSDHRVVEKPEMTRSEFCGNCHEVIYAQWSKVHVPAGKVRSCQQCHMPIIERKTVSGSVMHVLHPSVKTRKHRFAMLRPQAGEANISVETSLDTISPDKVAGRVVLTNIAAHHGLPSGEFGFRELAVIITLSDRYDAASAKQIERFVVQTGKVLQFATPVTVAFCFESIPADADRLNIQLVRSVFEGVEAVLHTESHSLRQDTDEPAGNLQ